MEGWSDCLLVLIVAWIDDQFYAEAIQELRRTFSFKPKMLPTVQELPRHLMSYVPRTVIRSKIFPIL